MFQMSLKLLSSNKCFGGFQNVYSHVSKVLKCTMKFGIYLPPDCDGKNVPVVYWLSGLTCTEQNFIIKSGAQQHASKHNFIVVSPDTSPRGVNIPGEDDSYDFGSGASFYVDATQDPWKTNYNMYSYITSELPDVINTNFPSDPYHQSIMGHSMGGHGALICYLKNPGKYRSVSAFAPICNPTQSPWGKKAFKGYLGEEEDKWHDYDATSLVAKFDGPLSDILIDQGAADEFLSNGQLQPENFLQACKSAQVPVILHMREGYDHSYFYVSSFIGEHFQHHAKYLTQ
ncbi:S-formylglutathione hydrolase isoform X1 [Cimex lectularius]|uniref:S-formylglutathione hydrolase n=2 Tax=Cimex lectularius TaxID=79782 RepID=A0A8I6S376_CIMLE|nr:S-formylglutathione hydrolase isoform X1 [Cimex lectularius]